MRRMIKELEDSLARKDFDTANGYSSLIVGEAVLTRMLIRNSQRPE